MIACVAGAVVLGGCGKAKPAGQAPVTPKPAAPAPAVSGPERTRAEQRMEQPAYLAEIKAIDAERKEIALEAARIQQQLGARATAVERENPLAAQARQSITNMQQQIEAKQAAIQELVKQDAAWQKLDAELQGVNRKLDAVQAKARDVVMAKMKEQSAMHAAMLATNPAARVARPSPPLDRPKPMTNGLPFPVPEAMKLGVKP